MGRSISTRQLNPFTGETTLRRIRDDRQAAQSVRSSEDLREIVSNRFDRVDGAVGQQIRENRLAEYDSNRRIVINRERVQAEAQNIRRETLAARFYPQEELDRELDDTSRDFNVSRQQARNIRSREAQVRAQAVLTAARAGDVQIDRNTRGILNNYARGDYERAIYGNVNPDTGQRTYARGRYRTELGFDQAERRRGRGAGTQVNTEAARDARRRDFIQNVQLPNFGRTESARQSFVEGNRQRGNPFAGIADNLRSTGQQNNLAQRRESFVNDDIPF